MCEFYLLESVDIAILDTPGLLGGVTTDLLAGLSLANPLEWCLDQKKSCCKTLSHNSCNLKGSYFWCEFYLLDAVVIASMDTPGILGGVTTDLLAGLSLANPLEWCLDQKKSCYSKTLFHSSCT